MLGDTFMIGTRRRGLAAVTSERIRWYDLDDGALSNNALAPISDTELLVSFKNGLSRFDLETGEFTTLFGEGQDINDHPMAAAPLKFIVS
jgi:hypothetical protein